MTRREESAPPASSHRLVRTHRVVIAAAAPVVLVLAQREVSAWVDRTGAFVSALALVVALLLLLDWVADLALPGLWRVLKSVGPRVARAVATDPVLLRALGRWPRLESWLRRRLSTDKWTGWYLTGTLIAAVWLLWLFVEVSAQLLLGSALVTYDPRVAGLVGAFRTPDLTRVMWAATLLGDALVVVALAAVAAGLLLLWGKRRWAVYLVVTLATGTAVQALLKLVVARPRPPAAFMLLQVGGYSYPSGHAMASLLLYGCSAVLAARGLPTVRRRLVAVTAALVAVGMVGLSRVYLGVHWPTDVLASWALGASWLALATGGLFAWERYGHRLPDTRPALAGGARIAVTGAVAMLAVGAVVYAAESDPVLTTGLKLPPERHLATVTGTDGLPDLPAASVASLPIFSEKLDGSRQEPIGIIFLGTRTELVGAFERAGWRVADQATVVTVLRAGVAAALDQPYETAPVTPTFLDGRVQDVAFQEATASSSARTRHHARFWATTWSAAGRPVWVATASFDVGIAMGTDIPLPTHRIAPDIDAESDYIVKDLVKTGLVARSQTVRVTSPVNGTNAQGDAWFTQGRAAVLVAR